MPIKIGADLRRLTQEQFGDIAYHVMRHAFDIQRELGRFFDEKIYQAELAYRCGNARTELPIEVFFDDFRKPYSIDLLVEDGALFEIKAVDTVHDRHRAQLLNYLLLCDLTHGKLVNFRPSAIQHEFVNANLTLSQRRDFKIEGALWRSHNLPDLAQRMVALLRDVGLGHPTLY